MKKTALLLSTLFLAVSFSLTAENVLAGEPHASFTAIPNPAACGQSILFNGSGSYHSDPLRTIVSYEWDFSYDGSFNVEATGVTTSHAYPAYGSYTAALRVTDDSVPPKTDMATVVINVNQGNNPPAANADGPYSIDAGQSVNLNGAGSSDPDAGCGDHIVSYEWDINNDSTYEYSGVYVNVPWSALSSLPIGVPNTIRLRVTDTFGATGTATTTLTINTSCGSLPGWTITQLTNNDINDLYPRISGSNVVWEGGTSQHSSDLEIYLYNGSTSTTTQLTNNSVRDYNPLISGSNVVWQGGSDSNLFFYNGSTTTQLTDKLYGGSTFNLDYHGYDISGSNVVYTAGVGPFNWDSEIFLYNGSTSTTTQLTNNSIEDLYPKISGSNVVWASDANLLFYNGSTTTPLTDNGSFPRISGSNVVWASDANLFFYNGSTTKKIPEGNDINFALRDYRIDGSNVVWQRYRDGIDEEIYLYNGSTTKQLTNSGIHDYYPRISGSNIIWQGQPTGDDWEIYFYNGSTITQVTDNSYNDREPQISSSGIVVWYSWDGHDWEIFMAVPCTLNGNLNGDCKIDWGDIEYMAANWLDSNCDVKPVGDLDCDCNVDLRDFAILAKNWLAGL